MQRPLNWKQSCRFDVPLPATGQYRSEIGDALAELRTQTSTIEAAMSALRGMGAADGEAMDIIRLHCERLEAAIAADTAP